MRNALLKIKKSKFSRNVGTLAAGTIFAQLITLGSSPILTRVYGPDSFAALALFMAIISSIAPGVCGRYEMAIIIAKSPEDSRSFVVISVWTAALLSVLFGVVLFIFYEPILVLLNAGILSKWVYFVPLGLLLFALAMVMRCFSNSIENYVAISRMVVGQALVVMVFSIVIGILNKGLNGLIAATLLGFGFAICYMVYTYWKELCDINPRLNPERRQLALKYKDFPLYNATTSILDGVTLVLPVFFLIKHYPEAIVGYYALLNRVATAPLGFISQAVSQVHIKKIVDLVKHHIPVQHYLTKITFALLAIVSVPTVIFILAAPSLFAVVFGENWREAGELLVILIPAISIKFVVSTLSGVFASTGNNHLSATWKISAFIATLIMLLTFSGNLDVQSLFIAMMLTDVALYIFYYYLIWVAVRNPKGNY